MIPQHPDDWPPFVAIYLPLIRGWMLSRFGLNADDADDAAQEVLLRVFRYGHSYDGRGNFRGWLYRMSQRECWTVLRLNARRKTAGLSGETVPLDQILVPEAADKLIRHEEAATVAAAMFHAQLHTDAVAWAAFVGVTINQRPAGDVARELGMTVGAVYTARCRVAARIRVFATGAT